MRKEKEKTISYHIFMFPFIFDKKDEAKIYKGWKQSDKKASYNEKAYFHKFFIDSMFGDTQTRYEKKEFNGSEFTISKSKEYRLNVHSVRLRLFCTGVGIISLHIENTKYKEMQDILEINEFGRRVYPEYLDDELKCGLVPNFVQLKDIKENFSYDEEPEDIKLSNIIQELIPAYKKITPAVDDRMFVMSYYINDVLSKKLSENYIDNDDWYEYVFIDADSKTVKNKKMQTRLIEEATYPRWQTDNTMHGMSRYSFVTLTDKDYLLANTQTLYFQIFTLILVIRATILKFSDKTSEISKDIGTKDITSKVQKLYKEYIQFVNAFYFREITAKDQGLEIYEKALAIFKIDANIKDLDSEIEELHKFVELEQQQKNTKYIARLNKIATWFIPISFTTGFLGMNIGETNNFPLGFMYGLFAISIGISFYLFKTKKGES